LHNKHEKLAAFEHYSYSDPAVAHGAVEESQMS